MKWYPWLTPHYRQQVSLYQGERGHHALLVHAQSECGEGLLVNALGRWLMCQEPNGEKTCGHCHSCQLMAAGNHPDWHVIEPENNKSMLGVEQIRQLTETLYTHSQQGGAKVAWIPHAELLTESAANALLKTLEEPPKKTFFFLNCREPNRLLATIRSRCLYWPIANPDEAFSREWLLRQQTDSTDEMRSTALRLCSFSPVNALQMLQTDSWQQRMALCQSLEKALNNNDPLLLLPVLHNDNAAQSLFWLSTFWLDAIKYQYGAAGHIINQDQRLSVALLSGRNSASKLQCHHKSILSARNQLLNVAGVNRELILTDLLCRLD